MARISRSRWLRGFLWLVIILFASLLVLREYVDSSGRRRWAAVRQMLAHENESLDMRKVAPAPVPDDQNFCALPFLKDLPLIPDDADPNSPEGAKRARIKSLFPDPLSRSKETTKDHSSLTAILKGAIKDVNSGNYLSQPHLSRGAFLGKPADMAAWAEWFRFYGWLPKTPGPNPAQDVITALSHDDSLVNELSPGIDLPESQWTPAWAQRALPEPLLKLTYPQFTTLTQRLVSMLCLRGAAAARAGDSAKAHQALLIAIRLDEATTKEPILIGTLVACGVSALIGSNVWELCDAHSGTARDFQTLQEALCRLDYQRAYLLANRGELAFGANTTGYLKRTRDWNPFYHSGRIETALGWVALHIIPDGWFEGNEAALSKWRFDYYIKPLRDGNMAQVLARQRELAAFVADRNKSCFNKLTEILALIALPASENVTYKAICTQSLIDESIAACALERYRIEHGAYPDTLDAVNRPGEKPIPLDPISGKAMGYCKTPNGRYILWCVALSGKDHGGKRVLDADGSLTANFSTPDYAGDWVWDFR